MNRVRCAVCGRVGEVERLDLRFYPHVVVSLRRNNAKRVVPDVWMCDEHHGLSQMKNLSSLP